MPGRRLNLSDDEAHDLYVLVMAAIENLSASGENPDRVRRLRALLERLS